MSHTHVNLLVHIVFSTQGRLPLISRDIRSELFAYIGGLVKELKGKPIIINGTDDHIHLLISLPAKVSLSDAMRFVKANSSRWVSERFNIKFAWQKGFGAFSVSRSQMDAVFQYIRDQEIHHRKFDLTSEFQTLLDRNGVEYDPRYLWE